MVSDGPETSVAKAELRFGPFRLFPAQQALYKGAERIKLGSRAFELLVVLIQNPGELVSKEQLLGRVWPNLHVDETALRVHVAALRKALGPGPSGEPYIVNVVGRGYRLSSSVTRVPQTLTPVPAASSQHPVSRALTHVIGREDVIASVVRQLPQHRLVTIVGAGGIGKTTVALAVVDRLANGNPDAVCVLDLSPLADDSLVPTAVATGLGLPHVADDPTAAVVARLRASRLLLVLDCCERVVEGTALLVELILATAPGVQILVTSREPLRVRGERVIRLAPLATPPDAAGITAAAAASYPAVQLFLERASASLEEFTLSDANAPLVSELCIRLDGIALAIELVAGHVNAFDLRSLADMLNDQLSLLGPARRTAVPRHRTLRAVLDWSFATIADREQVLLRRLAVFVGGAELGAVQDVTLGGGLARSDIPEALRLLVEKSLVVVDFSEGAARYRLLDMTRAYAAERLRESGEAGAVASRHARHYRDIFATARATWKEGTVRAWLLGYARQLDDVRSALRWAFGPKGELLLGIELTAEALPIMYELSLVQECRHWCGVALSALRSVPVPDSLLEVRINITLAAALTYTAGPGAQTVEAWQRVLAMATAVAFQAGQARALWGLWTACTYGGKPREALDYARRYAETTISDDDDDATTRLPGERIIGVSLHLMGEQEAARARLEGMLARYAPTVRYYTPGFRLDHAAMARVTLVRVLWVTGRFEAALALLEEVMEEVRRVNHPLAICYAVIEAAVPVLLMEGDSEGAARELALLRSVADQNGFAIWQAGARAMELAIQATSGKSLPAREVQGVFSALRATGYTAPAAWLSGVVAEARGAQEDLKARIARVDGAINDGERFGELWNVPELLRVKAVLTAAERPTEARALLARAAALASQQGAAAWQRRIEATIVAVSGKLISGAEA